jgi:hypothetical protein
MLQVSGETVAHPNLIVAPRKTSHARDLAAPNLFLVLFRRRSNRACLKQDETPLRQTPFNVHGVMEVPLHPQAKSAKIRQLGGR